ncbi:MAG: aldolase/citrate lyase family protein [Clostridiales bacterium]|nr:aldolase/citrate lyase family protein [Clostridiales bacterium]
MKAVEKFKDDLKSGKICLGISVGFTDPFVSYALADSVDFLWLELEHCVMNPETVMGHFLAAYSKGVPVFVRVPDSSTSIIKPLLDSGAGGIIVPQVRSAEEVRKVVNDCRYAPLGQRGFGPRIPSNFDRNNGKDYVEWCNRNIMVAVMIENTDALESLDDIVRVPGLDSVVIGAMDLSASLGLLGDLNHPRVTGAIDKIISTARNAGLTVGAGVAPNAGAAMAMINKGVQWLQVGNDHHYIIRSAEQVISEIRACVTA